MAVQRGTHPSADVLKAFASGKLSDTSADAVVTHLDQCRECSQEVAKASAGRTPVSHLPPELAANQQYEILRELGRGGMGVVYLAKNKLMDRLEVLKVVNKALLNHPGAVDRFLREIRSAAKLSHPNVVGAYHALQQGELLAFAMEYVEGQDLASLVKSQGPLPVPHACFYIQQAASGLQHAFEKQMVHRDIKPQNLILAREGKKHIVKVLDFGLAKVMREKTEDTGLTGEGKMLGTPDYIAPEQTLDAAKADIRADIYSLGCTLYYLLSGRPPFSASSLTAVLLAHQMQEAKALNLVRPEVPEELAAVVRKMMAKSPAQRYQTPLEVVQALSPFVKQGPTRVDPPPTPAAKEAAKPPEPANVWGSLTEGSAASTVSRKSAIVRKPGAATASERASQKKWLLGGGIGVGALLLALVGMWAGGMFDVKTQVKTKDGILVVEVNEPNPEVLVDGERVTVSWHNGGKKAEIHVNPGTHKVEIQKDGFSVDGKELTFKDGDRVIFTARLLPEKPDKPEKPEERADAPPPEKTPPLPDTNKPDAPRVADAAVDDKGFVPLFNGKDFAGWKVDQGKANQWSADGNTIAARSAGLRARSYLLSTKEYADFTLRLEFLLEPGGNGGIVVRAFEGEKMPLEVDGQSFTHWYPVVKLTDPARFLNEPSGTTHWVKDDKDFCKPVENPQLKAGEWHSLEMTLRGEECIVMMGQKKIVDLRADPLAKGAIIPDLGRSKGKKGPIIPALRRTKGKIGLLAHTGTVHFRNLRIKELLPAVASTEPPKQAANPKDSFFNEEDLTGWDGLPGYWQVKNGCIVGEPPRGQKAYTFLCSKKTYRDFDLKFRVKREGGVGNSGVQFRSQIKNQSQFKVVGPQCEIDDLNFKVPPGSITNEGTNEVMVKPSDAALDALGKVYTNDGFNDFHIRCVGKHVTIQVNNVTTVDADFPSLPDEGIIAWQFNGYRVPRSVWFRIIEFIDLSASASADGKEQPATKSESPAADKAAAEAKGFVPLFNGRNLSNWTVESGAKSAWRVERGELVASRGPSARDDYLRQGYLLSSKDYSDFILRFQFRLMGRNVKSGIALRAVPNEPTPQNYPYHLTVLLGHYTDFERSTRTGSLWWAQNSIAQPGLATQRPAPLNSDGKWNDMEIEMREHLLRVAVNGVEVQNVRLDQTKRLKGASAGLSRTKGRIGFMQRADEVRFRKIEIKELGKGKVSTTASGLKYENLEEGTGAAAKRGDSVEVHYTGWLTNGKKFDSSHDRAEPFTFKLGDGKVIKGWEEGMTGMKVGGKRKLTVPPELGYGKRGAGSAIPPDATLIFEIELLKIK